MFAWRGSGRRPLGRKVRGWAVVLALGLAGASWAQPAPPKGVMLTPEALQRYMQERREIDAALADYEAGRLPEAERGFRQLAGQGSPVGRYNLAMMHVRDEVARPDKHEAVHLLEVSADQGFVRSEYALGQVYELGVVGKPDQARSVQWYRRAAEHGHVDAQVSLATAYYLGRGIGKDMAEAAQWYRQAAGGGDIGAQYLIASMYEKGLGVDQDLRLARYWYDVAAQNGDEAAPLKVKEIDERLSRKRRAAPEFP